MLTGSGDRARIKERARTDREAEGCIQGVHIRKEMKAAHWNGR